jgi:hypothetical protein
VRVAKLASMIKNALLAADLAKFVLKHVVIRRIGGAL